MIPRVLHRVQGALSSSAASSNGALKTAASCRRCAPAAAAGNSRRSFVRFNTTTSASQAGDGSGKEQKPADGASTGFPGNLNPEVQLANLKELLEKIALEAHEKIPFKSSLDGLSSNLQSVGSGGSKQALSILSVYLLLSRGHVLSDKEIDDHLGDVLPPKVIELVKEKKDMLPPDPMMEKLKVLEEKLAKIEENAHDPIMEKLKQFEAKLTKIEQTVGK